jgi:hypothetical protein
VCPPSPRRSGKKAALGHGTPLHSAAEVR